MLLINIIKAYYTKITAIFTNVSAKTTRAVGRREGGFGVSGLGFQFFN